MQEFTNLSQQSSFPRANSTNEPRKRSSEPLPGQPPTSSEQPYPSAKRRQGCVRRSSRAPVDCDGHLQTNGVGFKGSKRLEKGKEGDLRRCWMRGCSVLTQRQTLSNFSLLVIRRFSLCKPYRANPSIIFGLLPQHHHHHLPNTMYPNQIAALTIGLIGLVAVAVLVLRCLLGRDGFRACFVHPSLLLSLPCCCCCARRRRRRRRRGPAAATSNDVEATGRTEEEISEACRRWSGETMVETGDLADEVRVVVVRV
ncbi:hypothetical protein IWX47DRAFT_355790 [Phyllosticta citricarpa]